MPTAIRPAVLGFLATMVVACASPQPAAPISVCDVLAAPETFNGQAVSIRGVVDTDYFEFSGIADARCNHRVISFGPENRERGGGEEVLSALQAVRDNPAARVEVTVDGVIVHRPGQVPFLIIDEMYYSDVDVVPWIEPAH